MLARFLYCYLTEKFKKDYYKTGHLDYDWLSSISTTVPLLKSYAWQQNNFFINGITFLCLCLFYEILPGMWNNLKKYKSNKPREATIYSELRTDHDKP